ncbi:hypothetical protein [Sulfurimonas sp.]|uniref:hypothetical protein n=1 Tax=Sulfurimonas sp. TaxID=2022749 RepID=UPI0026155233|nr:hypothetical protein [Sulfurimonas sp.]
MSSIFLSAHVTITLFIALLVLIALTIAAFNTVQILKQYRPNAVSQMQYELEKRSYLITTLIQLSLLINIFLLGFFIYTLNDLASLIPGAMCAAGVVGANPFGNPLLILKIIIILCSLLWLSLNHQDYYSKQHPYFKKKLYFFLFIYFLILLNAIVEINFFANLSTLTPVLCCSNIYAKTTTAMPFHLTTGVLVTLFYAMFFLLLFLLHLKKRVLITAFSILFLYVSYLSITYFFSTYIYELPTHKCPYCILGFDYYYVGYFIYGALLLATFYALNTALFNFEDKSYKRASYLYMVFVFLISIKFIYYLLINHTLL